MTAEDEDGNGNVVFFEADLPANPTEAKAIVPVGSLREIIIYPHTVEDMKAAGKTDADLRQVCALSLSLATSSTLHD